MKKYFLIFTIILIVILILSYVSCRTACGRRAGVPDTVTSNPVTSTVPSTPPTTTTSRWIYPVSKDDNLVWGIRDGIAIGVQKNARPPQIDYSPGGTWAPGLLYIMWTDKEGKTYFFNYIGFELLSLRGLDQSEPEKVEYYPENVSYLEKLKEIQQEEDSQAYRDFVDLEKTPPGQLSGATTINGTKMTIGFRLSKFKNNDTSIFVKVSIDSNNPKEISISAQNPFPDTRPLKYIHVSATAGSYARLRDLYLKDEIVNARRLFEGEKQNIMCFYNLKTFPMEELSVDSSGRITVFAGNDEEGQWKGEFGSPSAPFYGRQKYYQYWRKYPGTYHDDLKVTVNGRDHYFGGYTNPGSVSV